MIRKPTVESKRDCGGEQSNSIRSTVTRVLSLIRLTTRQRDAVWAKTLNVTANVQPAISQELGRSQSAVVFFKNDPQEGRIAHIRRPDGKIRMVLSRSGYDRVMSNWHPTSEDAFLCIALKCARMGLCLLYTSPSPRDGLLSRMPSSA